MFCKAVHLSRAFYLININHRKLNVSLEFLKILTCRDNINNIWYPLVVTFYLLDLQRISTAAVDFSTEHLSL